VRRQEARTPPCRFISGNGGPAPPPTSARRAPARVRRPRGLAFHRGDARAREQRESDDRDLPEVDRDEAAHARLRIDARALPKPVVTFSGQCGWLSQIHTWVRAPATPIFMIVFWLTVETTTARCGAQIPLRRPAVSPNQVHAATTDMFFRISVLTASALRRSSVPPNPPTA
jgi:hypothetical protein